MLAAATLCAVVLFAAAPSVTEGRRLFESLDYPRAEASLRAASQSPTLEQEERREVFQLLARAVAAQGRLDEAAQVYLELLAVDPTAPEPKEVAPKIRGAFQSAKRRRFAPDYIELRQTVSGTGLQWVLVDPWSQARSFQVYEQAEDGRFVPRDLPLSSEPQTLEPQGEPGSVRRFYAEVRGASNALLAQAGSEHSPLLWVVPALPAPATARPVSQPSPLPGAALAASPAPVEASAMRLPRWVGYVLVGVASAAAVSASAFALSSARDSDQARSAARAFQARELDDRAHRKAVTANALVGGALLGGAGAGVWLWQVP